LKKLNGILGGVEDKARMAEHGNSLLLRVEHGDLRAALVGGPAVIPAEAGVLQVGLGAEITAHVGVFGSEENGVAVLKVSSRRKQHPAFQSATLPFDRYDAHIGAQGGAELPAPHLIDFARQVSEIVLAPHCFVHAQSGRAEQIIFQVGGMFGVDVVESFVFDNSPAEAQPCLVALEAVLDRISRQIALEIIRAPVDGRAGTANNEGLS